MAEGFREFGVREPRDPASSQRPAFGLNHRGHESLIGQQLERERGDFRPEADVVAGKHLVDGLFDDPREEVDCGGRVDLQAGDFGLDEREVLGVGNREGELGRDRESGHRLSGFTISSVGKEKMEGLFRRDFGVLQGGAKSFAKVFDGSGERVKRGGSSLGGHHGRVAGRVGVRRVGVGVGRRRGAGALPGRIVVEIDSFTP